MMIVIGYLASALIGLSLGLIGGGGSILTVPVLVYLFHEDAVLSTSYSLFIVGVTSLVGALPKFRDNLVDLRTALVFGLPSIVAVYLTRMFIVPAIPEVVWSTDGFELTKPHFFLLLFALLMVAASISMIREKKSAGAANGQPVGEQKRKFNYPVILIEGSVVGVLTGLVGAGGGFLIIPALVLLSKLPMKQAVGTSLLIIAGKSLFGFLGDLGKYPVDWVLLSSVTFVAVIGIFIGSAMSRRIDGAKLKKGFGWFVLLTGIYMILKETLWKS
jgi:uncharacterized membrane protein YfcA